MLKKFRPLLTVEAIQFNGDNEDEILSELDLPSCFSILEGSGGPSMSTNVNIGNEQHIDLEVGDWIIKGVNGNIFKCDHNTFMNTYEEAEQ